MATLKYKKIYIDTKFKTADSVSTSNFRYELPETLFFGVDSVFYVDDIAIPHSWWSVEEDMNNKLYFQLRDTSTKQIWNYVVSIAPGNYTGVDFAAEVQLRMNTAAASGHPLNLFTVSYTSKTNSITIAMLPGTLVFRIITPAELKTKLNGVFTASYDVNKPNDCNEILSNLQDTSFEYDSNATYTSGYLNMQPIRNIYLHSPSLGNFSNIGPLGEQTVIKKIPVTSDYNQMIFDQVVLYNDYNDCSGQTLKTLEFQLRTSRGDVINLHGCNVSFSIIFSRGNPDL
jgi:hypothetical protein